MRVIDLTYQHNFRDLGGYTGFNGKKVKYGKIFRSGVMNKVTPSDIEKIKELKITDVIDFRSEIEFINHPDAHIDGIRYHNIPSMEDDPELRKMKSADSNLLWFLKDESDGFGHMCNIYKALVTSEIGIKAFSKFFELISQDDVVFDFHCSQGKDRAGIASYFFLKALGVSDIDALADYLYSNEAMRLKIEKFEEEYSDKPYWCETYKRSLEDVFSARIEYLQGALEEINKKYSSLENYIENVLHVNLERLRELYLE